MGLNVAVLANLKRNAPWQPGLPPDAWDELDSESTTDAIVAALESAGHHATFIEGDLALIEKLVELHPDICFNLCEGHFGDSRESHVPAILEMLRIPYTGAGVLGLALTLDKPTTQRLLDHEGVPVPAFQVFMRADASLDPGLRYPLFVKPSREGSSIGIDASSIVREETELRRQVAVQLERYRQPILVEQYVAGREITVGIVGNVDDEMLVLPPLEVELHKYPGGKWGIYTAQIKSDPGEEYYFSCPAPLSDELDRRMRALAVTAFQATGCRDAARVDFRVDAADHPYVIEVNALPGIAPGYSDLSLAAEAAGISYPDLVNTILAAACRRYRLTERVESPTAQTCHLDRFRVVQRDDSNSALVSLVAFAAGDVVSPFRAAEILPAATRYSIQTGVSEHVLVNPEFLRFMNHSCDPSVMIDTREMAVKAIKPIEPGDEITYFYPSTEWSMAEPFECACGAPHCLTRISGAVDVSPEALSWYGPAEHIIMLTRTVSR